MKLYKGRMMFFCCLLNLCILIFQSDIHGYKLFKQVAWNSSLDIKMNMPVPIKSLLVCTVHCKLFPECSMLAFNESLNQCMVETNTPHRTLTAGWNLYMALGKYISSLTSPIFVCWCVCLSFIGGGQKQIKEQA